MDLNAKSYKHSHDHVARPCQRLEKTITSLEEIDKRQFGTSKYLVETTNDLYDYTLNKKAVSENSEVIKAKPTPVRSIRGISLSKIPSKYSIGRDHK